MPEATDTALSVLHFFDPPEEFSYLTRDDPTAFAPPPAFGPFRVLHQVGVGALGPVFRTYEPTRDRLVAVKVFRLDITPEQAQSLADALGVAAEAGLFHPSVVEPIAAGVEGTVAYRAEEYVAAESLDVALRHYAPAPIDKVLPFIAQLAGAIDFARAAGVGHGALHPRDIFVTPDEARATGFGVVEALERVGLRAPVRRPYSAPERVEGGSWGTPADVFSLGAIAYELLTARRPAGTGPQIGPLPEVASHGDQLHAVLARAMDEDPGKRFQTALAFASALEAAVRAPATGAAAAAVAAAPAAAAPVVAATDDEIEDSVAAMSAPIVPDEQEAPAETSIEEEEFRAEPASPLVDDFLPAAAAAAALRPETPAGDGDDDLAFALQSDDEDDRDVAHRESLFDDEEVEDLAVPPPAERFTSDFDPRAIDDEEPEPPAEPPARDRDEEPFVPIMTRGYSSITDAPPLPERPRNPVFPYALFLLLGLLVGFGAGYAYAMRTAQTTVAAVPPTSPASAAGSGQGKEYSEQAVAPSTPAQPPAEAPTVPGDAPAAARTPEVAGRRTGSITIQSTPPKAAVTVDGTWRGRTPLTVDDLKFGSYTIRIIQDGYAVDRHIVPLSAQAPQRTISARLQPLSKPTAARRGAPAPAAGGLGSLYVDSRPRGARVMLDGKAVGVTPLKLTDLPAGSHAVQLELADHQTWRTRTTIVAGQEARVTGSLDRIR